MTVDQPGKRVEIRIAGFGGQGVVLMGYILGKALALYDGYEAVMTQSYGPEARGGASSANVVFSERPIAYPFVQHPDVLVALSQEAFSKFLPTIQPNAMILIDKDLVTPDKDNHSLTRLENLKKIPATRIAEELGRRIVANMVMLGFFTATSGLVSQDAMQQAIESSVKAQTIELNMRAFRLGYEYQQDSQNTHTPGSEFRVQISNPPGS